MRKLLIATLGILVFAAGSPAVFAGDSGTVLPPTEITVADCKVLMSQIEIFDAEDRRDLFTDTESSRTFHVPDKGDIDFDADAVLACGIKTGQMKLWMLPYYIRYVLQFIIGIAGLIAIGGILYGGYLYLFAGISEDKDKGKKAIMYGIAGMIMTLVAWAFVNIVIGVVTA